MTVKADVETVDLLNDLLQTCRDREQGYRAARDGIKDETLRRLFDSYVQQSVRFARELETAIHERGEAREPGGTLAGAAFRGWMNVKAALTGGEERAVLAECERGEDVVVEHYQRALRHPLPEDARAIIARQWSELEQAHTRIRSLRDAEEEWLDG
jgi:uncharacterized protein (TIGR02284 family)